MLNKPHEVALKRITGEFGDDLKQRAADREKAQLFDKLCWALDSAGALYRDANKLNDSDARHPLKVAAIHRQVRAIVELLDTHADVHPMGHLSHSMGDVLCGKEAALFKPRWKVPSALVSLKTTCAQSTVQHAAAGLLEVVLAVVDHPRFEDAAAKLIAREMNHAGLILRPHANHNGTKVTASSVKNWRTNHFEHLGHVRAEAAEYVEAKGKMSRHAAEEHIRTAIRDIASSYADFLKI